MFRVDKFINKGLWAAASQIIQLVYGIAAIFLIVKALPSEEFGTYILSQGIVRIIVMVGSALVFRHMVRELSVNDWDPKIPVNAFALSFLFNLIAIIPFIYFSDQLSDLLNTPLLATLIPLAIPIQLAGQFFKNFVHRLIISSRNPKRLFILNSVYFVILAVGLVYLNSQRDGIDAEQIIYLTAIAGFVSAIVGWLLSWDILKRSNLVLSFNQQKKIINFGKYVVGSASANTMANNIDSYIIAYILGPLQVAMYSSAKVIFRFYQVISQMMDITVFPYGSKLVQEGRIEELKALYEKLLCFIYLVLFPVNIIAILLSKSVFELLYGGRYEGAYLIMQLLIVGATISPAVSLNAFVFLSLEKPKTVFFGRMINIILVAVVGFILTSMMGPEGMALAFIVGMLIQAVFLTVAIKKTLPVTLRGVAGRVKDVYPFIKRLSKNQL